jgi:endonuclease YncB( thermonuclease family)
MRARQLVRSCLVLTLVALPVAFLLAAPASEPAPKTAADFKGATAYQVVRIIDGDTVEIRIDGRDTKLSLPAFHVGGVR